MALFLICLFNVIIGFTNFALSVKDREYDGVLGWGSSTIGWGIASSLQYTIMH